MAPQDDGSVTRWIGELRTGGDSAAQHLWERYFDRLVNLARARLRSARRRGDRGRGGRGAERLRQLLPRHRRGAVPPARRPRRPLATAGRHHRPQGPRPVAATGARKRGGGRLAGESALIGADAAEGAGLDRLAGDEAGPELAAMVVDEYRRLRDGLRTDELRLVLDLRLEGYTREEIAQRLGCAERTVRRSSM